MLPKKERITKKDFEGLKVKIIFRGEYADIASAPSPIYRFACVISKKRIKKAVDRNRARRRIYSILEKIKPKTPRVFVFYPKVSAVSGKFSGIKAEITKAFDTLH